MTLKLCQSLKLGQSGHKHFTLNYVLELVSF